MTSARWMLTLCLSLVSVLRRAESDTTTETEKYTCKTFGSGVVQTFNGSNYYVRSNCPFTLTHFTHNRVECDITIRRGESGLLVQVEIIINKITTVLQNGSILVEGESVSLPYDHTYQHIFHYGIYTKLRSSLLPVSLTWHNVPGGIDTVWVELEQELSTDMTGLCGQHNVQDNKQGLISGSVLSDDTCQIQDHLSKVNQICRIFFSYTLDCLQARIPHYISLCEENIYEHEMSIYISCAFFKEVALHCGNQSFVWNTWRSVTSCATPMCPGDLVYVEQGPAFIPSCSNPDPRSSNQDLVGSCVCPEGKVLNDHAGGSRCVNKSTCPCVFDGVSYSPGHTRTTKCQSCMCDAGQWRCSENMCPAKCVIEGYFVTTFDGKQYTLPGKCMYVASEGRNWTITIGFSKDTPSLETVVLQIFTERYIFSHNMVRFDGEEITELHQHRTDHATVFWQSSMYVQVLTSFGLKIQVQVSPQIQLYITPPENQTGTISGLCGNSNSDTTDDFTTSSGIIENSAQPFALSWSLDVCPVNIPPCMSTINEIFAEDKCSVLNNPTGIFAKCHGHVPTDHHYTACVQRTCNCGSNLQECLCVALGSYAKACACLGIVVGDWRKATNCTMTCQKNQKFSYSVQACNRTCSSLSSPDLCWGVDDEPVEGCGCPEGTHLNQGHMCTPKSECFCNYYGGTVPPGSVVIDGRQCVCENGGLRCSPDCGCQNGKVCVHCAEYPVNTAQKTCDSLSKPVGTSMTCKSGCYCPHDQYEDHHGNCVSRDNCTCVYSGKVFSAGQHVTTNCKTCICGQGQWHCTDEPCSGKCQVYGNGHYQTFDTKWYRFDGHCQYTLVEDYCGNGNGTFSVRVESVPCCDEALTCSRRIILDLQDTVTLTLSDMKVTRRHHGSWSLLEEPLYSTHTVGLYIIISVPSRGIMLIWDKHTRITIELHPLWRNRVCGLCGNFDANEMNDLQIRGSSAMSSPMAFGNSWKAATPPCSDVTTEIFPCERKSYCSAWAQRRCMIITGDTFKDCHLQVDPEPYYQACVQESCSCEFEGKFLGFCTAVAAYAEACNDQDVCVNWRAPDLCPVYCDYYNEKDQCSWHYEPCGEMRVCGNANFFTHKLEGCYPRCSKEAPYYDENTGDCTPMSNCTCYFNNTIVQPGAVVLTQSIECRCENGIIKCTPPPTTPPATTSTSSTTTTTTSTTATTKELYTTTPTTTATTELFTSSSTIPTTTATTEPLTTTPTTTATTELSTSTPTIPTTTATTELSTSTPTIPTTIATTELSTSTPPIPTTTATTELSTSTPTITTTIATTEPSTSTPTIATTELSTSTPTTAATTEIFTTITSTSRLTTAETTEPFSTSTPTIPTTIATTELSTSTPTTIATTEPSTSTPTIATTELSTSTPTTAATTEIFTTITSTSMLTTAETTEPFSTSTPNIPTTIATTELSTSTPTTIATTEPSTSTPTIATTELSTSTPTTAATTEIFTTITSTSTLTTAETTEPFSTSTPTVTNASATTETGSSTSSTSVKVVTDATTTTIPLSEHVVVPTNTTAVTTVSTTTETWSTPPMSSIPMTSITVPETKTSMPPKTTSVCECKDLKRKLSWSCGEMWTEDCFKKTCQDGEILLSAVDCPEPTRPSCPRNQVTKVSGECCDTFKCDCLCELYGDPHYISFQGVTFDFLDDCTYILVEERSPLHHLTIAVDNFHCVPGLFGSCAKGIILKYQNNTATLEIIPHLFSIQATLNNMTINPPYEEHGLRFETTGYVVSIHLPEIRSYVSLSPTWTLVVRLAMEHFHNNTQGQCGVCGVGSCIRKGGQMEDDTCCDRTAYDWVYKDPRKPSCTFAPQGVPCKSLTTTTPSTTSHTTSCPERELCEVLDHPVFANCSMYARLADKKSSCEFDACRNGPCSSLEQAAEECKRAGFCVDWRGLTKGTCDVKCPEGLVFKECRNKNDDFCFAGARHAGASLENNTGCFCPDGKFRAGNHSNTCVRECSCDQSCTTEMTSINVTVDNCTAVVQMPVCQGRCASESRVVLNGDLQVEQTHQCCQEHSSERRAVTLPCSDHSIRHYNYKHITGCDCRSCVLQP